MLDCSDSGIPARSSIKYLFLCSILLAAPANATTHCQYNEPGLKPYTLKYQAKIGGLKVTLTRSLSQTKQNRFRIAGKASYLFIGFEEYSEFEVADNKVRPLEYFYDISGPINTKDYHLAFSWETNLAENLMGGDHWTLPLQPGMQDLLSHQEQMRLDIHCATTDRAQQIFAYTIAKKKRIRDYQYRIVGEETLKTGAGRLRTLKLEKLEEDDMRKTTIWLALDWDYIVIRLKYEEKGKTTNSLELLEGEVGSKTIYGLKKT